MIQDILPHVFHNEFRPELGSGQEGYVLYFQDDAMLCQVRDGTLFMPRLSEIPSPDPVRFLFTVDATPFYLGKAPAAIPEGWAYHDVRTLRPSGTKLQNFVMFTGKHLSDWYRDNQFCGRCGGVMAPKDTERAMTCPSCGYTSYPRIMPAVIVGVKNGDSLLLTRYRAGIGYNALIAGFTEIGETLEETVRREVMEEAGIRVKNIRYYKSQPWGIANDILMGFYCEVDGDTEIHMDTGELSRAEWVPRAEIILQPDDLSLTNEMMNRFRQGLEP